VAHAAPLLSQFPKSPFSITLIRLSTDQPSPLSSKTPIITSFLSITLAIFILFSF
jgi:hypothetical protein